MALSVDQIYYIELILCPSHNKELGHLLGVRQTYIWSQLNPKSKANFAIKSKSSEIIESLNPSSSERHINTNWQFYRMANTFCILISGSGEVLCQDRHYEMSAFNLDGVRIYFQLLIIWLINFLHYGNENTITYLPYTVTRHCDQGNKWNPTMTKSRTKRPPDGSKQKSGSYHSQVYDVTPQTKWFE